MKYSFELNYHYFEVQHKFQYHLQCSQFSPKLFFSLPTLSYLLQTMLCSTFLLLMLTVLLANQYKHLFAAIWEIASICHQTFPLAFSIQPRKATFSIHAPTRFLSCPCHFQVISKYQSLIHNNAFVQYLPDFLNLTIQCLMSWVVLVRA
mgnify:CR=1 FL=1